MDPLDCAQVCADLSAFLDGELGTLKVEAAHAHFEACPACTATYDALREQLVRFEWEGVGFVFDPPAPEAVPGLEALQSRLSDADLGQLGRTLYEILKAQFLHLYGEGLEPDVAPVGDVEAHREQGTTLVEALRDWHDDDQIHDVELSEVQAHMRRPDFETDPVRLFIDGMAEVGKMVPELGNAAVYWQAIAHVKAGRQAAATALFETLADLKDDALARSARVCLATLPVLFGTLSGAVEGLERCLAEDPDDAIVLFNLAKAHYLSGSDWEGAGRAAMGRALRIAPEMVRRQLARPSERSLRMAAQSSGISMS